MSRVLVAGAVGAVLLLSAFASHGAVKPPKPAPGKAPGAPSADTSDLSDAFFTLGYAMGDRLGLDFTDLLRVMNFESGGVYANAKNPGGAYGLIQLAGSNLAGVGWPGTGDQFIQLTAEEQLPYVESFLSHYAHQGLISAPRIHQALFVPATLGDPFSPSLVLAAQNGKRWPNKSGTPQEPAIYAANAAAFDPQKTGAIVVQGLANAEDRAAGTARFRAILARAEKLGATS